MRRRHFLAATSALGAGAFAGCLGSGPDDGTGPNETGEDRTPEDDDAPLAGRSQWGYDARHSRYAAGIAGPVDKPTSQGVRREIGGFPLISEDTFYVSVHARHESDAMRAVGFDDEVRWEVPDPVEDHSLAGALYEDTVLNAGHEGTATPSYTPPGLLWARSKEDGSIQWRTGIAEYPWPSHLTVFEDRVYVVTPSGIACVDLVAQQEAWHVDLEDEVGLEFGVWSEPAVSTDHVFTVNYGPDKERDFEEIPRQLYALDPETGALNWTVDLELSEGGRDFLNPVIGDDYVFVIGHVKEDPDAHADHRRWIRVVAVDPGAREVVWSTLLEGRYGAGIVPAVANGRLYVSHGIVNLESQPKFSAIDTADGSVAWTAEPEYPVQHPLATDDLIYAVDNSVRALEPETGDEHWRIKLFERSEPWSPYDVATRVPQPPVIYDGRLFVHLTSKGLIEFA